MFLELPALQLCLEAMVYPEMHPELGADWNWDGEAVKWFSFPTTIIFVCGGLPNPPSSPSNSP